MEAMEAIRGRRAIRSFGAQPVAKETLETLIEAAICAPSGLNRQPWSFAVIEGRERLADLEHEARAAWAAVDAQMAARQPPEVVAHVRELLASGFSIFHGASAVVVFLCPPDDSVGYLDTAFAAENLMIAAHALGLGTCPVGLAQPYLQQPETLATLGVPTDRRVVLAVVVGEPDGPPPAMPPRHTPTVYWS